MDNTIKNHYSASTPIYQQVQNMIVSEVFNKLNPGDKIPNELELCKNYNVSRTTIRQALNYFIEKDYIRRFKGKGSFLNKKPEIILQKDISLPVPTINFIVPCIMNTGTIANQIHAIEKITFEKGYQLVIHNVDNNPNKFEKYIQTIIKTNGNSGVIFIPLFEYENTRGENIKFMEKLKENNIPVVVIDRLLLNTDIQELPGSNFNDIPSADYDFVIPDNVYGGYLATKHLLELGHKKIAYIGEPVSHAGYSRLQGYVKALKEFGVDIDCNIICRLSELYKWDQTEEIIKGILHKDITAIFAEHDLIAREVLLDLQKMNIKVPDEISLIGYDDLDSAQYLSVPLTTIRQPVIKEVELATEILFDKIQNKNTNIKQIILPVELIVRKSTNKIRDGS